MEHYFLPGDNKSEVGVTFTQEGTKIHTYVLVWFCAGCGAFVWNKDKHLEMNENG